MTTNYYPSGPASVPEKLTKLPSSYTRRAVLAILAIILFFVLYFTLVATTAYIIYLAIKIPLFAESIYVLLLKLGAIAGAVMLFVFTLKFLFKLKNFNPKNRIIINKKNNPHLVGFIHQLCSDTHAPRPRKIYADPDVNAYVSYSNTWLSLIFPVRKDLTIGLGLVECLNISEFKAVCAHEFGHFSQRSMKIGSYVHSANTIIHDMIYTRDSWDRALATWRASDIRLSAAAWIITPIIWSIRQLLKGFYLLLNLLQSSLSREMEFNADKVSVSVCGSNSIVSSLWKLDLASASQNDVFNHAFNASQKNLFVKNIFPHYSNIIKESYPEILEKYNHLPMDTFGGKQYFEVSSPSGATKYASHPLNYQREQSAKNPFIACETDEQSPWVLFSEKELIQESITEIIYTIYFNKKPTTYNEDKEFIEFIESEKAGEELNKQFHNTFNERYLMIPDEETLTEKDTENKDPRLTLSELMIQLEELMKPVKELDSLLIEAEKVANGTSKTGFVTFNGKKFNHKNISEAYNQVFSERNKLYNENFPAWDKSFCQTIFRLAEAKNRSDEFIAMCRQAKEIATISRKFHHLRSWLFKTFEQLNNSKNVTEGQLSSVKTNTKKQIIEINDSLDQFGKEFFIKLPNIDSADEFRNYVVSEGKIKFLTTAMFENNNVNNLIQIIDIAIAQLRRIDNKSITSILLFQNEMIK